MEDGRRYQKPLVYNKHLPYADVIESEAKEKLSLIKQNLSAAVQRRDVTYGYIFWIRRLQSFITVYGMHFSKEDHILFIKLAFELLTSCTTETHHTYSLVALINSLLKKRDLLSRDDLQLPWRPVYKLYHEVFHSKGVKMGLKNFPRSIEQQIVHLVSYTRTYFPVEATQEILDEWRPKLCCFDMSFSEATEVISSFLPVVLKTSEHNRGFRLWFDEMIHLWLDCFSDPRPDKYWLMLFANISFYNIGYIDWNPHLPEIFTRILRGFQLPVGNSQLMKGKNFSLITDYHLIANLVVSMMGGSSKALEYLNQLMVSIDSYFHPSNTGAHTRRLESFVSNLTNQFINRLHRERFKKPSWLPSTPEEFKLTEKDIDAFVDSILPAVRQCLFSKFGPLEATNIYQQLALLRPQKLLPDLLEKMYAAFETLTEPHQLFATLQCVAVVARPLLRDTENFPEGKSHLFPLLTLAIPGIDPNDYKKTLASAMLLSELITMVPLVDSSRATDCHNMTEMESELCSLTSQFEDIVLQLFDRCFLWIENSSLEQVALMDRQVGRDTKKFNHESLMSSGIVGTVSTILMQSSPSIAKVAIERLFHFTSSHVFESEVSGDAAARMCGAASKYHPKLTLPLFVPHCVREIRELLEDPEHTDTDTPDKTLLWKLQLLSKVLNAGGEELLPYGKDVLDCLLKCLHLTAVMVYESAASAISSLLQCLTQIYPMEGRSLNLDYSVPAEEHCYIRDWALPGDINQLNINWHVPSAAELDLVDSVLNNILGPELDALERFSQGEDMDRKELNRRLTIVLKLIEGAAPYLPQFGGEQVLKEGWPASKVSTMYGPVQWKAGAMVERKPPERFSRRSLAMFFDQLTGYVCSTCEDDTKSILSLTKILSCILINFGTTRQKVDQSWKSFIFTKKSLGDRLRKNKQHLRPVLISRVYLQHEQRMIEHGVYSMTELHHKLIKWLQNLGIGAYPEVRMRSQEALAGVVKSYRFGIRSVVMDMPKYLQPDPEVTHEQFKGALYILKMPAMTSTYLHKLELIVQLLPTIVTAGHSEKPSILALVTDLVTNIIKQATSYQLHYEVSETALALATSLGGPLPEQELAEGEEYLKSLNDLRVKTYKEGVEKLVDLFEAGNLTWRFAGFCVQLLSIILMHWSQPFPTRAVRVIVNCLVHDTLTIRKVAIKAVANYLWLIKKPVVKIPLDFRDVAGTDKPSSCVPGEREDNEWLLFDPEKVPRNSAEWNNFPFMDKSYIGYYTWSKTCMRCAPLDQQARLKKREEMTEGERIVFDSFSSEEFVSKLIGYLSLEEKKGVDRFSKSRMEVFLRLSKVFGDAFLPLLKPHLESLAISSNESKQRCACEVIAGLVRGSKHWTFEMVKELQEFLKPLLRQVLGSITEETITDWIVWASEVAADRDPHRIHWILELLADNPLKGTNGSFKDFSQLCVLQTALAQQEWKIGRFHQKFFEQIKPHLGHSFKTVRDILGRVLMTVCMSDAGGSQIRHNLTVNTIVKALFLALPKPLNVTEYNLEEEETKVQLRVFKTGVNWVLDLLPMGGLKLEYLPLFAAVLPLVNIEGDDELTGLLQEMFSYVSHAELPNGAVKGMMDMVQLTVGSSSWKIRKPALHVLQVMVFGNLFKFAPLSKDLDDLLMQLMRDENVEVREVASDTVSGLMRCGLFTPTTAVQRHFKKLSRSKVTKKKQSEESTDGPQEKSQMMERHAGVLGLAALVGSCPYSVPDWLPDVLEELAGHLHDPAPIPATVKRAMNDFKRTHYDNWRDHKQKFTEDQLIILNDLLISPSYYA